MGDLEYGKPLFYDIDYDPIYTFKPFSAAKCTRTEKQHVRRASYCIAVRCVNCRLRDEGKRADDMCKCE